MACVDLTSKREHGPPDGSVIKRYWLPSLGPEISERRFLAGTRVTGDVTASDATYEETYLSN